jgi:hypothetical protein
MYVARRKEEFIEVQEQDMFVYKLPKTAGA